MIQKPVTDISVIQSLFGDWMWQILTEDERGPYDMELQIHEVRPREVDDYKLCGLYEKTAGKATVYEVPYTETEGYLVHENIVRSYYDTITEALKNEGPVLMAGGHCTWAPGVAGAIREYWGPDVKIGIMWMDAHGDIKSEKTSDNRLLAGLPLGTILGFGMENWRRAGGLETPLDGRNVLISDYRVRTPEVVDDFTRAGIQTLDTEGFNDPARWKAAVQELADRVDIIYFHIDIDILLHEYVPTFIFPTPGGNELDVVLSNVRAVMDTGKVFAFGVYNTLFDTDEPGQAITTLTGMKLIAAGLENWKQYPAKD